MCETLINVLIVNLDASTRVDRGSMMRALRQITLPDFADSKLLSSQHNMEGTYPPDQSTPRSIKLAESARLRPPPTTVLLCVELTGTYSSSFLAQSITMLSKSLFLTVLLAFPFAVPGVCAEGESAMLDEDDEYADPVTEMDDQALLIAYKQIKESKIVQGVNMTVAVSLYNVGKG